MVIYLPILSICYYASVNRKLQLCSILTTFATSSHTFSSPLTLFESPCFLLPSLYRWKLILQGCRPEHTILLNSLSMCRFLLHVTISMLSFLLSSYFDKDFTIGLCCDKYPCFVNNSQHLFTYNLLEPWIFVCIIKLKQGNNTLQICCVYICTLFFLYFFKQFQISNFIVFYKVTKYNRSN